MLAGGSPLARPAGVGESDLSLAKFRLYVKERSACMLRSGDRVPPGNPNNEYMADSSIRVRLAARRHRESALSESIRG